MKKSIIILSWMFLIHGHGSPQGILSNLKLDPISDSLELVNFVDSIVQHYDLPGLSATSILGQEVIWKGHFGYQSIEDSIPVDDSTLFTCWSVSKPFTGTALMQHSENGIIDIDLDVNNYIDFPVVNPNYPLHSITSRQVLSHVSSINDGNIYSVLTIGDCPIPLGYYLENYLVPGGVYYDDINYLSSYPPGTYHQYCNVGTALAGYLVDTLYSGSFKDYCQDSIFSLLDMGEAGWFLSDIDTTHLASLYNNSGNGNILSPQRGVAWYPAASLRATAAGLSNYVIAMLNGGVYNGNRILEENTVIEMSTPQYPSSGNNYGLCLGNITSNGRNLTGHNGNSEWGKSKIWWCQDENTGIVILTNVNANTSAMAQIQNALFDYALISDVDETYQQLANDYLVYPNPVSDKVFLQPGDPGKSDILITVYDMNGRCVHRYHSQGKTIHSLDLSDLLRGIYVIRVQDEKRSETIKVVKI